MHDSKILIGTLYSGENEFDECIESVKNQTYKNVEHIFFEYLPNKEAHDTLYKTFMERADEFDYFIKLDADMVFNTAKALEIILGLFEDDPELDHLEMAVDDRYSDSLIMGLHIFSNRIKWLQNDENLFVDHKPEIPGKYRLLWDKPAPLVKHCPNPSPFQAYRFGVHRALKAFQPDRLNYNRAQSKAQWKLLNNVWDHFTRTNNYKLGLCMLGAEHVIGGLAKQQHYSLINNDDLYNLYKNYDKMSADDLKSMLDKGWQSPITKKIRRLNHISRIMPRIGYYYIRKFIGGYK